MHCTWDDFATSAPALADLVKARFESNLHHVIGTVRVDGSPRLSGTEVVIDDGEVSLGMMPGSMKLADVTRDPRVEIHSAPLEEDLVAGDVKLAGRLLPVGDVEGQPGSAFVLDLARVNVVQVRGEALRVSSWTPERGVREVTRP
jgi:hypothetical protein